MVLVIAAAALIAGLAAADLAARAAKMAAGDRMLAQARCAADTGVERIKAYLLFDPLWSDGSVAVGPVDETSEVVSVDVKHSTENGVHVTTVTSVGRCLGTEKAVRTVIQTGEIPLVFAYGGGIKQLKKASMVFVGSCLIKSDLLVNGSLSVSGDAAVGLPGETRNVYADGDITVQKTDGINGNAYATGEVSAGGATGQSVSNWLPPAPFPDVEEVEKIVDFAREAAREEERTTGVQHYFPGSKTFTAADLAGMDGIYFAEGGVTISGGTTTARASVVSAAGITVAGALDAANVALITAGDVLLQNSKDVSVALVLAKGDAGWGGTGGGSASWSLKCGALAAGTVNNGFIRGNVTIEQNGAVDFGALAAPIHTAQVISRTEL
jgi:hypothetical protein